MIYIFKEIFPETKIFIICANKDKNIKKIRMACLLKSNISVVIGKNKINSDILPSRITENEIEYIDKKHISETFNDFFVNTGPNLASKIQP